VSWSDSNVREPFLLWRAMDEETVELDVLVQKRRDMAAAKRLFKRGCAQTRCPARSSPIIAQLLA
jgi:putative transposase